MKGLLIKDIRMMGQQRTVLAAMVGISVLMAFTLEGSFLPGYLSLMAGITAIGTVTYDEADNGFQFLFTLPVDCRTYVREKYVFCIGMLLVGSVLGTAMELVRNAFTGGSFGGLAEAAVLPLVMVLMIAVMIPLQLKFGAERARVILMMIYGGIAVLAFLANRLMSSSQPPAFILALDQVSPALVLCCIAAVIAVLTLLSYLCSVRIMEKKEF